MPFFWRTEDNRSSNPITQEDITRAETLRTAVRNKAKICKPISLKSWADEFRRMRTVDGLDAQRIDRVLHWYAENIRGKFVPLAFSAGSFRQKFLNIEISMERVEGPSVTISLEAKQITNKLMRLRWPSTTKDSIEKSVQVCLDAYNEFLGSLRIILPETTVLKGQHGIKIPNSQSPLYSFVKELKLRMPAPSRFVEQWFHETNKRILNWDGYDGDLRRFEIVITDNRFKKYGREIAARYCGDAKRFDLLLKSIS